MKKALITGINGQDGSYLAELLLSKGYQVHGLVRRASTFNTLRIQNIFQDPHADRLNIYLYYGDITDAGFIFNLLQRIQPDEIYNLAAQSHVRVSFEPATTHGRCSSARNIEPRLQVTDDERRGVDYITCVLKRASIRLHQVKWQQYGLALKVQWRIPGGKFRLFMGGWNLRQSGRRGRPAGGPLHTSPTAVIRQRIVNILAKVPKRLSNCA